MKKYISLITLSVLILSLSGCAALKEKEIKEDTSKNMTYIELNKLKNCTEYTDVFSSFDGQTIPYTKSIKDDSKIDYVKIGKSFTIEACLENNKILLKMTNKSTSLE